MDAMHLIANGQAMAAEQYASVPRTMPGCGIIALAGADEIKASLPNMDVMRLGELPDELPCNFALILNGLRGFRLDLMANGFQLLERWQMAAPLWSYTELACHIGSEADRAQTKAIIRDLRVPVYDVRAVFVRKCDETAEVLRQWKAECGQQ